MSCYPNTEMTSTDLFKQCVRLYYSTLKRVIFYILLICIFRTLFFSLSALFSNSYSHVIVESIAILAMTFFFSAALLSAHCTFTDQPQSIFEIIKLIWHRGKKIGLTFLAYVMGTVAVYYFTQALTFALDKVLHATSPMHGFTLILTMALLLLFVAMFYFAFPLSIIDSTPTHKAFYDSLFLTEKNKTGVFVLLIILGFTILFLSPAVIHINFLSTYHLYPLFDFIVLCAVIPIYINTLLLLISDSKVQMLTE